MAAAGASAAGSSSMVSDAGVPRERCPPVIPFTISSAERQRQYIRYIINGYEVSVNTRMPVRAAAPSVRRVPSFLQGARHSRKIRRKNKNQTKNKTRRK
jgi:hypothetical protein